VRMPRSAILLLALTLMGFKVASAQSADLYFGLGTATANASLVPSDTFGNGTLYNPPKMGGLFATFGGGFMITPHFGVGAETSFRMSRGSYAGLTYRPNFYDVNAIYHPISGRKRIVPEFQAGLGGVNLKFYANQQYCDAFAGCSSSNTYLESSNHLQAHFSAGLRMYVKNNFYIRPQVDVHWVNNFFQFGSSWVPEYGAAVGYTFRHD
jgi:hypothetical protein